MSIEGDSTKRKGRQVRKARFDTGDIDRWVGVPLGGNNMKEAVHVNEIRRWVQGMQNPNPLFYDDQYANESRFRKILAPQSFTVCASDGGGGRAPAIQGRIEGTHGLACGDEWWFYGPRISPGDNLRQDRMLFDYRIAETKFAGLALFSRGDTTYINQRGEIVAKQRATVIRYRADEAVNRKYYSEELEPDWTDEQLDEIEEQRFDWIRSFRQLGHDRRLSVKVGDKLARCPIGPHSMMSIVTEWRSFPAMVWGAFGEDLSRRESTEGSDWSRKAGWVAEMARRPDVSGINPSYGDAMYRGPARGHANARYARLIGIPREYGYGVSMGTWMLDYVANWVGEWGEVVHSKLSYHAPALIGDVAFIDGEVTALERPDSYGPIATIRLSMTNQREELMASGSVEIRLPTETIPLT